MRKNIFILLLLFIFSFSLIPTAATDSLNTYSDEEKHLVSNIFDGRSPMISSVLNTDIDSLSDEDKFCLCRETFSRDYLYVIADSMFLDKFEKHYYDIFGEKFSWDFDSVFTYYNVGLPTWLAIYSGVKYKVFNAWSQVNPPGYRLCLEYISHEFDSYFGLWEYEQIEKYNVVSCLYYLKDYKFYQDKLDIYVGFVSIPNQLTDEYKEKKDFYNDFKKAFGGYCSTSKMDYTKMFNTEEPVYYEGATRILDIGYWLVDGIYPDRNYFSSKTDHSLWEKYSDYLTMFTMTYHKDENGEWHWVSCTETNQSAAPETYDRDTVTDVSYTLSVFISVAGLFIIALRIKKRTESN